MFTAAPAIKAYLVDAFAAEAGVGGTLEGVQVAYSWPKSEPTWETIVVGESESTFTPRAMRPGPTRAREEELRVMVHLVAFTRDGNAQAATERAFALMEAVEAIIRDDPTLGGNVTVSDIAELDLQEGVTGGIRQAYLLLTVGARAHH